MGLHKELDPLPGSPPQNQEQAVPQLPDISICAARIYFHLVDDSARKVAQKVFFSDKFSPNSPVFIGKLASKDFQSANDILDALVSSPPNRNGLSPEVIQIINIQRTMVESDIARLLIWREILIKQKRPCVNILVDGKASSLSLHSFQLEAIKMAINQAVDSQKKPSGNLRLAINQHATFRKPRRSSEI